MNTFTQLYAALAKRDALGLNTYGKEMEPFDGRDTIQDALDEALDLLPYLTKAKQERDEMLAVIRLAHFDLWAHHEECIAKGFRCESQSTLDRAMVVLGGPK